MNWSDLLYIVVSGALGLLTTVATIWIKQKMGLAQQSAKSEQEKKYFGMLEATVTNCVLTTNQTFVSNLKKENMFNEAAQKAAFSMTYQSVMNILSADAQKFLNEAYNDVPTLITQMIEAEINKSK
jgi:hypothetical protein